MSNRFLKPDRDYNLTDKVKLSPEQIDGVEFLLSNWNAILGLQTGLGKTLTALTAALHVINNTNNTVCFIICPKAANTAFIKEISVTLGQKYSICVTGNKGITKGARFIIFNYSNLKEMVKYLTILRERGYKVFAIFDEVHQLQSAESNLSKLLRSVRSQFACVFGMTATPLLNELEGTYRIIDFVRPGFLGSIQEFRQRYIVYRERTIRLKGGKTRKIQEIKGYRNLEELSKRLESVVIVRRLQYNINFIYKSCALNDYEEEQYKIAADGILVDTENEKAISARLHDLQRVADGTHLSLKEGLYSKIRLLLSTIQAVIQKGEGCIVYTEYEDTYTKLGSTIADYKGYLGYNKLYYITGKTPYKDRVAVERSVGPKDVVVMTRAGAQSINLQALNNVIFYNTPFSTGWVIQCVGRVARMDSTYDHQDIYILEAVDTIDTYKRLLIQDHAELIRIIFGKEGNLPDIGKLDKDAMSKYRSYFKRKFLWKTS